MRRETRTWLVALLALLAVSAPPAAGAMEKTFDAAKVLPLLDSYLALPFGERDAFRPAYFLHAKSGALDGVKVWIANGGQRSLLPVGRDGRLTLPDAAHLRGGAQVVFDFPEGVSAGIRVKLEASMPLALEIGAASCERALAQADAAQRKAGGFLSVFTPRLTRVVFVGAGSGETVMTGGAHKPLPLRDGQPFFAPSASGNVTAIRLKMLPRAIWLETG